MAQRLAGLLLHKVEVYRRKVDEHGDRVIDRFGQEESVNPRQHETEGETLVHTYPCRAYMKQGGLTMEERSVDVFERQFIMYTEIGVDIHEDDAVRVIAADGHQIVGLSKIRDSEVKYDHVGPHHCEFTIWEQAGPGTVE